MKKIMLTILISLVTIGCVTAGGTKEEPWTPSERQDYFPEYNNIYNESHLYDESNPVLGKWRFNTGSYLTLTFNPDMTWTYQALASYSVETKKYTPYDDLYREDRHHEGTYSIDLENNTVTLYDYYINGTGYRPVYVLDLSNHIFNSRVHDDERNSAGILVFYLREVVDGAIQNNTTGFDLTRTILHSDSEWR